MSVPTGGHDDWLWGLGKLIPRDWNSEVGPAPDQVYFSPNFDKEHNHPDVPNDGAFAVSFHPKYGFSFATVLDGWLFAIGTFRYDYADGYYTFPRLALKKLHFVVKKV